MPITLTAINCPKPTRADTFDLLSAATPHTAKSFLSGETNTVVGKLNANAVQSDLAFRYGGGSNAVLQGLVPSASTGLSISLSAGHAIAGTLIEVPTAKTVAVPASTPRAWIWLDSTGTPQITTNLTAPGNNCVLIGNVVTDAGNVVTVDTSGVCYLRNGMLWRETADVAAPTDSPLGGMVFLHRTSGGTYLWDGLRYLSLHPASVIQTVGTSQLGFYGSAPVSKSSVADPVALTAPSTLGGTYTQSEVQSMRTDIANLRATVLALTDALQAIGLV